MSVSVSVFLTAGLLQATLAQHTSRNPPGTAAHFRADLGHETRDRLPSIACPTLVVHGDQDLITLPWYNETVAVAVPGARRETVADAGHLVSLERPDQLNAVLAPFFAEHLAGVAHAR